MEVKIVSNKKQENIIKLKDKISGYDLLHNYSKAENKKDIVAFLLNNQIKDLFSFITNDANIKFISKHDFEGWKVLNYSGALILGEVVKKLYPTATVVLAHVNDDGFYLDFDYCQKLKQEDLIKISEELTKILQRNFDICYQLQDLQTAIASFDGNPFLQAYLQKINYQDKIGSYLIDQNSRMLATHVALSSNSAVKYFQLFSITGAYWMGDDKNKQLQRITGLFGWDKKDLATRIATIEERKSHDHRILGKKLGIFMFNDEVGKGLPIFLPKGMAIKKALQSYLREQEFKWDYQEVSTPVLGSVELYKASGHWDHYHENMFTPIVREDEQLVLRPMTCPHHCVIYKSVPRSYRDLPLRLSEHALLYRYESSGALTGLERVRAMELTDSHIFVRLDQIKDEFKRCYYLISEVLKTLNIKIDYFSLSLRDENDKEKYYPDDRIWEHAETALREVLDELQINYQEMVGEAAFYGPKFDIQIKTPLGHEVTISTIQFDFLLPKKFNLTYIDHNNQEITPVIVHRGLIGTYERFIATLLEQTQGVFPLWLAPVQVAILPVGDDRKIIAYSQKLFSDLKQKNMRVAIFSQETLGKRIKQVHESKIPYILILGSKEVEQKTLTYHTYKAQKSNKTVKKKDFFKLLKDEIAKKQS